MLRTRLLSSSLALCLGAASCAPEGSLSDDATSVALHIDLGGTEADQLDYEVSAPDISPPLRGQLAIAPDGTVRGRIDAIPAGVDRTLTAHARDSAGNALCQGASTFDVTPRSTVAIELVMHCASPGQRGSVDVQGRFNFAPLIHSIFASATRVAPPDTVNVAVTASDPDGDALSFQWTALAGTFANASASTTNWTPDPEATGTQTLTVTVRDARSAVVSASVEVEVAVQILVGGNVTVPTCTEGQTQACGFQLGSCQAGVQVCTGGTWSACTGGTLPTQETCNGLDDDCDGVIDEELIGTCECIPNTFVTCDVATSELSYCDAQGRVAVRVCTGCDYPACL